MHSVVVILQELCWGRVVFIFFEYNNPYLVYASPLTVQKNLFTTVLFNQFSGIVLLRLNLPLSVDFVPHGSTAKPFPFAIFSFFVHFSNSLNLYPSTFASRFYSYNPIHIIQNPFRIRVIFHT